ncbi:hypothetical protein LTR78_003740 [Recurvomyces mirabilis]|uniref:RFX-type winged-helix domain-containing protein n=1 Tax=Recurvomyces mirabilis TaxID=574656 RepID=A0AAE0WR31_9PEZI|nr:hypothetical protein LTR78_003740 [Recurvomyces mirabilis]KAK5154852.1 hypothetical protein LTS14_006433 [Recurvomyces mirabilis]
MAVRHRPSVSVSALSRPQSRASTTSATSQRHEDSSMFMSQHVQPTPEAQLLQYQANNQQPMHGFVDAQQHGIPNVPGPPYAMQHSLSFSHDSPYMQGQEPTYAGHARLESVAAGSGAEMGDDKRRKGSAATATNDKELREMLTRNEGRPLRDVAQEVIQKERTPMAEKTKQLFAMLWLRAVCKPAKSSVPRNRVYSQYANRCGTERVVPLNPASFGKLVRVIFPGIQTRRLGVRGESKYHYVDLALEDENMNPITNPDFGQQPHMDVRSHRSESASTQQIDFNNMPRLQADTAAFPAADQAFDFQPPRSAIPRGPPSQARAFAYPDSRGMQAGTQESMSYSHCLRFPSANLPPFSENEPVNLPPIASYLPYRTDYDTAESLVALYRTHVTSLIDSIRFCKEKQFFRLYTSFHGTLTVPVQKLFTHPNLAGWIEECDLVMYRTMVRFVSRLTLQAAPVVVINILSNISASLHGHIAKTFAQQPAHVLEAKLRPATVFAGLLYRLIRVNQSAHAAANLLTIDQNREQMWVEWVKTVNPKRVMEAELPDCGYEEVYKIMTSEMRSLLEPLQAPAFQDDPYGFTPYNFEDNGSFAQFLQNQTGSRDGASGVSTENVLDRWSTFISSIPGRFPQASARTILHCISAMGTAALRDITIMNGQSYGHWWVLKIFVDEMALWLAEMGGFLEPTMSGQMMQHGVPMYQSPVMDNGPPASQYSSHRSSMAPDSNGNSYHPHSAYGGPNGQQQQQTFQPTAPMNNHHLPPSHNMAFAVQKPSQLSQQSQQHETDIDDSGIGMSLMEDEISMSKFGNLSAHVNMGGLPNAVAMDAL